MVFLVVESSPQVRESLCHVLLAFGVRGLPVADRAAAREALGRAVPVEGAIVDIDNREVDGAALVEEMKSDEKTRGIPVIVHTVQTSRDSVLRMVELGVAGYLLKPFDPDTARAKLAAIFSKLTTHDSHRRHFRVKPDPDDLARVSFRTGTPPQLVAGRIVDISLGGMAVELFNAVPTEQLFPGASTGPVTFALAGRQLAPQASVVLLKARVLALRFNGLAGEDARALERYIFRRISS